MQPRLLQIEKHRVNAIERAETSLGEAAGGLARFFERIGISQLQLFFPSPLEDAQNVARLGGRKSRQRINERQNTVSHRHFWSDRHRTFQTQWNAVQSVSLPEAIILGGISAVVVESSPPKHRAMPHHAVADILHDLGMTEAARLLRHAQVPWVHKLYEIGRLMI